MALRIAAIVTLTGVLSLHCKPSEGTDTEASSTGTPSSSSTAPDTLTTPTTSGTEPDLTTTDEPTTEPLTSTTTTTGATSTTDTTMDITTGPPGSCKPLLCDGAMYACGDCMDNDGDGKYDSNDPECISPCDDQEDTFATGLPGDNMDPCKQDCFFDGNSGNDACDWNLACDPLNPGGDKCPYDEKKVCEMSQPQECADTCLTPNGCDCFGCCTITANGMEYDVFIGDADCSVDNIENCEMCSKNDDCDDACEPEKCEICLGGELPPGCDMPGCDEGAQGCMIDPEGNSDCPEGFFCQTGCCAPIQPG